MTGYCVTKPTTCNAIRVEKTATSIDSALSGEVVGERAKLIAASIGQAVG